MNPSTDNQTPNSKQQTTVEPASLADLRRLAKDIVECNYLNADDPEHNVWPFAVLAPSEMSVPLIVWLPPFEDEKREAFVMSRWLPSLSLALDSTALVVGSPVWAAPFIEPRPTAHPERWEMVSITGASRDGEEFHSWADVTRAPEKAPQLGAWCPFAGEDMTVGDMMGWALAGAVGCFSPEHVRTSLAHMGKEVLLHRFADDTSRDEAGELIRSVQMLGLVNSYVEDPSELFCVLEYQEDALSVRELLEGLATEDHPTPEQLNLVLETHVFWAPMARAGCFEVVVSGKERGLETEEDDVLFRTAILAVGRAREEKGVLTKPVLVELPIRNKHQGNRGSRRAAARGCRERGRRTSPRRGRR